MYKKAEQERTAAYRSILRMYECKDSFHKNEKINCDTQTKESWILFSLSRLPGLIEHIGSLAWDVIKAEYGLAPRPDPNVIYVSMTTLW